MRLIIPNLALFIVVLFTACQPKKESSEHVHDSKTAEAVPPDTTKKSIPKEAHAQMGKAHVTIKYHAPAVRGRTIWGGLVPYDEVWVTGAHSATSIETSGELSISGTEIPPGKYAFFTIPGKDKWTVIFNKNWDQHLADEYDQKEDIIRIEVRPELLQDVQERLKYSITKSNEESGFIEFMWERMKLSVPFETE